MNILVDTNIVLDVLLEREPWLADAEAVWQACDEERITGYLVASTVTDIYYIARRIVGRDTARKLSNYVWRRLRSVLLIELCSNKHCS